MIRVKQYKNREWLYREYVVLEKSLDKAGKECGASGTTILNWLRKYNISRRTLSESKMGKSNPMYGRIGSSSPRYGVISTKRSKAKMSAAKMGENNPMYGKIRPQLSEGMIGEKNPNFNDWASREPYCYLWDELLREKYRNYWGRVCVLSDILRSIMGSESGLDDFEGHEIFSSRRLTVHHSRGDKMEGCNGKEMALIPIQNKFNVKKFDGLRLEEHSFYVTLFLLKDIERKHRKEMLGI